VTAAGAVEESDLPAAADLATWVWDQYRLETTVAGKLGFSVGSVDASRNGRTLIAEFSRSKTVTSGDTNARVGVAARLIVNVTGIDAKANLTLPFVAAEAQFNRVEAYANLTVDGYIGPDVGDLFPDFTAFDVESYVKLMESLSALRKVIGAHEDLIRPTRLWAWSEPQDDGPDLRLTQGVATAWALTQIKDGHPREQALAKYRDRDDTVAHSMIESTYAEMLEDAQGAPSDEVRARARRLLDGYELHHPLFGA
jgi:hypothetical protein